MKKPPRRRSRCAVRGIVLYEEILPWTSRNLSWPTAWSRTAYPRLPLTAENAAAIPCRQVLGAYSVSFTRHD